MTHGVIKEFLWPGLLEGDLREQLELQQRAWKAANISIVERPNVKVRESRQTGQALAYLGGPIVAGRLTALGF
jgi:hypothetical protein